MKNLYEELATQVRTQIWNQVERWVWNHVRGETSYKLYTQVGSEVMGKVVSQVERSARWTIQDEFRKRQKFNDYS